MRIMTMMRCSSLWLKTVRFCTHLGDAHLYSNHIDQAICNEAGRLTVTKTMKIKPWT